MTVSPVLDAAGRRRSPATMPGYGGTVMSAAAAGKEQVIGLVYVAGFAPAVGESTAELTARYPGSTLAETLVRVSLPGGGVDLYIEQNAFHEQFCHDVPADVAALMAATQRPMTQRR